MSTHVLEDPCLAPLSKTIAKDRNASSSLSLSLSQSLSKKARDDEDSEPSSSLRDDGADAKRSITRSDSEAIVSFASICDQKEGMLNDTDITNMLIDFSIKHRRRPRTNKNRSDHYRRMREAFSDITDALSDAPATNIDTIKRTLPTKMSL